MNKAEITRTYNRLQRAAEKICFDAIAAYCKRHQLWCLTNGPFGSSFTRHSTVRKPGYVWNSSGNRYERDYQPKAILELMQWYEDKFGPFPQSINDCGKWV